MPRPPAPTYEVHGRFGVAWRGKAADIADAKERATRANAVRWSDISGVRAIKPGGSGSEARS